MKTPLPLALLLLCGCPSFCPEGFSAVENGRCVEDGTSSASASATGDSAVDESTCEDQGLTTCDDACVNPENDADNCGTCGHGCSADEVCHSGECAQASCVCDCECQCDYCSAQVTSTSNDACGGDSCSQVCGEACYYGGCGNVEYGGGSCNTEYD